MERELAEQQQRLLVQCPKNRLFKIGLTSYIEFILTFKIAITDLSGSGPVALVQYSCIRSD